MSSSGLLCLKWNNHTSAFDKLLNNLHLKDVYSDGTIVCYGKFYPVHRFVLSTCSEYFDEIFRQSINLKSKHPFIIVKDIQPPQMEALLNYMYRGEVNVPQEMLPELIKAAEAFKIKGLAVPDNEPAPSKPSTSRDRKRSSATLSSPSSHVKRSRRVEDSSKSDKISSKSDCDIKACEELQTECSGSGSINDSSSGNQKGTEEVFISEILQNEVKLEPTDVLDPEYKETKEISDISAPREYDYISPRELGIKEEEEKSFDSYPTSEPFPPYEDEGNLPTEDQYDLAQSSSWDNSQGFEEDSNLEENDSAQGVGHYSPWISSVDASGQSDGKDTTISPSREPKYKCSFCSYQNNHKYNFAKHLRKHTGEKPFQCHLCSYRFSQKENLKKHLLIHSGEKPFSCPKCPYKASQKQHLEIHMLQFRNDSDHHSTESSTIQDEGCLTSTFLETSSSLAKRHKCSYCSYATNATTHLRDHLKIHTGERPFACHLCNYRAKTKSNLKSHVATHTGEKCFHCQYCSYSAIHKINLLVHLRKHEVKNN